MMMYLWASYEKKSEKMSRIPNTALRLAPLWGSLFSD